MPLEEQTYVLIEVAEGHVQVGLRDVVDLDIMPALEGNILTDVRGEENQRTRGADLAVTRADRLLSSLLSIVAAAIDAAVGGRHRRSDDDRMIISGAVTVQDLDGSRSGLAVRLERLRTG